MYSIRDFGGEVARENLKQRSRLKSAAAAAAAAAAAVDHGLLTGLNRGVNETDDGTTLSRGIYWDLTIGGAINTKSPNPTSLTDLARSFLPRELRGLLPQSSYLGTSTFETPQVAFAYERGWRDSFKRAGFPGPDEEFKLAEEKLLPHAQGKVLLDASCGSGLFTRRFLKSGNYGCVIALDFSDAMLTQARQFFKDEGLLSSASGGGGDGGGASDVAASSDVGADRDDLAFVRADIARVPFPEGTVGGVHAGAAIHCWPEPRAAVAEIARVLEPGGTFCGTTFLTPKIPFGVGSCRVPPVPLSPHTSLKASSQHLIFAKNIGPHFIPSSPPLSYGLEKKKSNRLYHILVPTSVKFSS